MVALTALCLVDKSHTCCRSCIDRTTNMSGVLLVAIDFTSGCRLMILELAVWSKSAHPLPVCASNESAMSDTRSVEHAKLE